MVNVGGPSSKHALAAAFSARELVLALRWQALGRIARKRTSLKAACLEGWLAGTEGFCAPVAQGGVHGMGPGGEDLGGEELHHLSAEQLAEHQLAMQQQLAAQQAAHDAAQQAAQVGRPIARLPCLQTYPYTLSPKLQTQITWTSQWSPD